MFQMEFLIVIYIHSCCLMLSRDHERFDQIVFRCLLRIFNRFLKKIGSFFLFIKPFKIQPVNILVFLYFGQFLGDIGLFGNYNIFNVLFRLAK